MVRSDLTVVLLCLLVGASFAHAEATSSGVVGTIVTVGDRPITRTMVDRQVDMMAMFLKHRNPKLSLEKLEKYRKQQLKPLSDQLFLQTFFDVALAPSNVVPNPIAVKNVQEDIARKIGRKDQTFSDVRTLAQANGYEAEFDRNVAAEIRFHSYLISAYSNRYFVTSNDLARSRARIAKYNERAIATNRVIMARAKMIMAELDRGVSFAALADRYSEDEQREPGGALGDCDANDFVGNTHIWSALQLLQPKERTELMTLDDGYAVYRVNRKVSAAESETTDSCLNVSRIFFRRPYIYAEKSDEELYDDILETRHEKLFSEVYLALRKTVNVVYNERESGKERKK